MKQGKEYWSGKEAEKARKAVKTFDSLPVEQKSSILALYRSAAAVKVDERQLSGLAILTVLRPGVHFRFVSGMEQGGAWRDLGFGDAKKLDQRVILLNPEGASVGKTILHEMYHDMYGSDLAEELGKAARKAAGKEFCNGIADRYTKAYNGISVSEWMQKNGLSWTEETYNRYFEEHDGIRPAWVEEEISADAVGHAMNAAGFVEKLVSKQSRRERLLLGVRNFCRRMARKAVTVEVNKEESFAMAFRDAMRIRRKFEIAMINTTRVLTKEERTEIRARLRERDEADLEWVMAAEKASVRYALSTIPYDAESSSVRTDNKGAYLSIDLDSEAQRTLGRLTKAERRTFVREYMNRTFRNIDFSMTDGRIVSVTGTGTAKIAESSFLPKQQAALEIGKLFKVAKHTATAEDVEHKKFSRFDYYTARVEIGGEMYSCVLNVGLTKEKNYYQIYDVNQFETIKGDAPAVVRQLQGLPEEAYPVRSASNDIVADSKEKVNSERKKSDRIKFDLSEAVNRDGSEVSSEEVVSFVENVLAMKRLDLLPKRKQKLGTVSSGHAEIIRRETGLDIVGYEIWIDGSAVRHIAERHGEHGEEDSSIADIGDYGKLAWVLNHAQNGEALLDKKGEIKTTGSHINSDQSRSVLVRLYAEDTGSLFFAVECVPDNADKRLWVVSAYKQKNSGTIRQASEMSADRTAKATGTSWLTSSKRRRTFTSETAAGYTATNSIDDSTENVNSKGRKKGGDIKFDLTPDKQRPLTDADYRGLKEHFGVTRQYEKAGYLLTDGSLLDFSGRHWGDDTGGYRQVDHREVKKYFTDSPLNGIEEMVNMIINGNIRLMPESGGIDLSRRPTAGQITTLRGYINHFHGEVILDIDGENGRTLHSITYPRGTASARILRDITEYFDNGSVPLEPSPLNSFRYDLPETSGEMEDGRDEKQKEAHSKTMEALEKTLLSLGFEADKVGDHLSLFEDEKEMSRILRKTRQMGKQAGMGKVYSKKDSRSLFDAIVEGLSRSTGQKLEITGKNKNEIVSRILLTLCETGNADKRQAMADQIADLTLEHVCYEDYEANKAYYEAQQEGIQEYCKILGDLRKKLKIPDSATEKLKEKYGKDADKVLKRWKGTGETSMAVPEVLAVLQENGFLTEIKNADESDILIAVNDAAAKERIPLPGG